MKTFRGFRVKPDDRGMTYTTSAEDNVFEGSTLRFEFAVVAKNLDEANSFCCHALGEIPYELKEAVFKQSEKKQKE